MQEQIDRLERDIENLKKTMIGFGARLSKIDSTERRQGKRVDATEGVWHLQKRLDSANTLITDFRSKGWSNKDKHPKMHAEYLMLMKNRKRLETAIALG